MARLFAFLLCLLMPLAALAADSAPDIPDFDAFTLERRTTQPVPMPVGRAPSPDDNLLLRLKVAGNTVTLEKSRGRQVKTAFTADDRRFLASLMFQSGFPPTGDFDCETPDETPTGGNPQQRDYYSSRVETSLTRQGVTTVVHHNRSCADAPPELGAFEVLAENFLLESMAEKGNELAQGILANRRQEGMTDAQKRDPDGIGGLPQASNVEALAVIAGYAAIGVLVFLWRAQRPLRQYLRWRTAGQAALYIVLYAAAFWLFANTPACKAFFDNSFLKMMALRHHMPAAIGESGALVIAVAVLQLLLMLSLAVLPVALGLQTVLKKLRK